MPDQAIIKKYSFSSHPLGLWIISIFLAFFCYGFVSINSTLVLYAHKQFHMTIHNAYLLSASYNSLLFTLPLLGGAVTEKLGYQRGIIIGTIIGCIGLYAISINSLHYFFIGLSLYAISTAFFVPSAYVIVDKFYSKDDPKRESGFTLLYIILNTGFLVGSLVTGYLHQHAGYATAYRVALIISAIVLPLYFISRKSLIPHHKRSIKPQYQSSNSTAYSLMLIIMLLSAAVSYAILNDPVHYDIALAILTISATIAVIFAALRRKQKPQMKLFAFIILSYFSIGFWALYSLEPSLLTVFIHDNVNRFHASIPASSFYSLDSFFVIIFGVLLSKLWLKLSSIKKNPSLPAKFCLALFIMSLGFICLIVGIHFAASNGLVNPTYIVICYVFLAVAELLISPIGISMVGRLSPEGMEGRLMGVWQLFTGVAGAASGWLAQFATVPDSLNTPISSNPVYASAFFKISLVTITLGILCLFLLPKLRFLVTAREDIVFDLRT
jgi:proton-dependent oligopeptide transporter, POT family